MKVAEACLNKMSLDRFLISYSFVYTEVLDIDKFCSDERYNGLLVLECEVLVLLCL